MVEICLGLGLWVVGIRVVVVLRVEIGVGVDEVLVEGLEDWVVFLSGWGGMDWGWGFIAGH